MLLKSFKLVDMLQHMITYNLETKLEIRTRAATLYTGGYISMDAFVTIHEQTVEEDPMPTTAPTEEVPTEEVPIEEVPIEEVPIEEVPTEEVPTEEVPTEEVPTE